MRAPVKHDPDGSGREKPSASTGSSRSQGEERFVESGQSLHQMVRGRHAERSTNCIDRHLPKRAKQTAIIWEGDDPEDSRAHHLCANSTRGLPLRQCAEGARRQERRPRHHLSADDSGSGLRDARLRAYRRGSFRGVRRASRPTASPAASRIAPARSSSPRMKACAAASRSRSRRTPIRR